MSTPRYVIEKVGDQYIPVLQDPYPQVTRGVFVFWGLLMMLLAGHRRGIVRQITALAAVHLLERGILQSNWTRQLLGGFLCNRVREGKRSEAPSYQNDFAGRARQMPADLVDEQVMESFPASDPPARQSVRRTAPAIASA